METAPGSAHAVLGCGVDAVGYGIRQNRAGGVSTYPLASHAHDTGPLIQGKAAGFALPCPALPLGIPQNTTRTTPWHVSRQSAGRRAHELPTRPLTPLVTAQSFAV